MKVHLEGMGITGCLLALHLAEDGHAITWHDTNAPHAAWQASTGAIFPAGRPGSVDWDTYLAWADALHDKRGALRKVQRHFEPAAYWFNHVHPPHHARYSVAQGPGGLQRAMGDARSYHLNAQTFVPAVRKLFGAGRRNSAPAGVDAHVVAHGFGARMKFAYWGWTVAVRLRYAKRAFEVGGERPSFYFRKGRFVMAYAYPIPGTDRWYAGSSLIRQRAGALRELDPLPKFERWRQQFELLGQGEVKVVREPLKPGVNLLTGWRPARDEAKDPFVTLRRGKLITVPPLWNSGIRHFPGVLQQVRARLEELQ